MGGAFGEMMMAAIGGVVCFVVIKQIMIGQNTVGWSTLEITLFQTIVPLLSAVGVIFAIFAIFQRMTR
jgi:hypothetical protein